MKSSYIGRSLHEILESCLHKITEIERSVSFWQKDDLIKANISATEGGASRAACMKIVELTAGLSGLAQRLDATAEGDEKKLEGLKKGMAPSEWQRVIQDCDRADSPVECQLRVLLTVLAAARKNIHEVITKNPTMQAGPTAGVPVLDIKITEMHVDLDEFWEAFLTLKALLDRGPVQDSLT
jgi:hypothetical protein